MPNKLTGRLTALKIRHRFLPSSEELTDAESAQWVARLFIYTELSFVDGIVTTTNPDLRNLAAVLNATRRPHMLYFPLSADEAKRAIAAFDAGQLQVVTIPGHGNRLDHDEVRRRLSAPDAIVPLGCAVDRMLSIVNAQIPTPLAKTVDNILMLLQWRLNVESDNTK